MTRNERRMWHLASAGLLAALTVTSRMDVSAAAASLRTEVTVSRAIAVSGAILHPGIYTFEIANPGTSADVVRVREKRAGRVVFAGHTVRVRRPDLLAMAQPFVFGEAPSGHPAPVIAWYPPGRRDGYAFVP